MTLKEKQKKIFELLAELDPKIAETYKGGIEVLERDYSEKIAQSAHSLREMIYLLTRLDEIKKLGKVKTMGQGRNRKQDLIKNLDPIKGAPEDVYILYDELTRDMLKWFAIVAHHIEFPNEKKFRKKVEEFEILIEKTLKPHFEVINEINKILSIAKPTRKDFNNLKQLISRNSSAYNHFFQNANAKWLPFLIKDKYLKDPPHISEVEGERRFSVWSPATYLCKASSEKPKDVAKIILNFKIPKKEDERNPWLLDYFIKAAVNMPPKYGKLIARKIHKEKWTHVSYHNYLDRPISELMKKLTDAGCEKETVMLARTLLDVKLGEPYVTGGILEDYKKVQDVKPVVDHYWYGELLKKEIPYVFKKFPNAITELLIDLVTKMIYLENVGRGDKKSKTDASAGWRPAIEEHEQNWEHDFRSQLLGELDNFLIQLGKKSIPLLKQTIKKTAKIDYPAFRRLELHVFHTYPQHFKNKIDSAIEQYFDNYELHHEYFHLLKNTFSQDSKKTRKKYLSFIKKGPRKELLELWKEQAKHEQTGFIDLKIRLWKSDKLKPILNHLTQNEKDEFKSLIGEERGFPHPDFHVYSSGAKISEPVSELKDNLTPEEVFEFVKSYKTKELDFGFHDGTPEKFQDHVQKNPETFSKLALKCEDLKSIFAHKFFRGIEEAVKQKKPVNWKPILSLCEKIIDSVKQGKYGEQKEFNILNSIASLLEKGIGSDSIDFTFRKKIWELLRSLTTLEDVDRSWEESYPREDWDAFGISINTINGITFHAILRYAIWCNIHLKKEKRVFVPEVKELISNYLDQKLPSSISRQAVLGYYLSTLYYFDKKWIITQLSKLFKNQNEVLSRAAWDSYLLGKIYRDVFEDLSDEYFIHVRKLSTPQFKDDRLWKFDERVIEHITLAYFFKMKNAEKIFNHMLNHSHEKVLSHCAWHIGRILKEHKDKPSKSFDIESFRKIWKNSKLTSNEDLRSWVEYSPFGKNETLQLLYNSLKKSTKSIRFLSFLVEELESYAKTNPQSTLKCLDVLVRARAKDPEFHIGREGLRTVLKILFENKKTKKKTITLIHHLGELGYNEYSDLLDNNQN